MTSAAAILPPAWERAVAYGDGFFETVLVIDGRLPLWVFHRQRLLQSAQRLAITCDVEAITKTVLILAKTNRNAIIKIVIARSGGKRGYSPVAVTDTAVSVNAFPLPQYPIARLQEGVHLHVCRQRLSMNPALAGLKHLNRLEQVLAASELHGSLADEGLMLDSTGAVIEGISSNIFLLRDKTLLTPTLKQCGVAGVMRAAILKGSIGKRAKLPVRETRLTLDDCLSADGLYICNSIWGVQPVKTIGVSRLPVHQQATEAFWEALWNDLRVMGYTRLYA